MRKIAFIFVSFYFVSSCTVSKQVSKVQEEETTSLQAVFDKDVATFFNFFNEENWESMIGMMSPEMYKVASKEQMIVGFNHMKESGMSMTVNEVEIYRISEAYFSENKEFRKLNYTAKMKIKISEDKLNSLAQLEKKFKGNFGEENVKLDKESGVFLIHSDKALIAILEENSSEWKYLEFNESQPQMLKTLFSEAVYQHFETKE